MEKLNDIFNPKPETCFPPSSGFCRKELRKRLAMSPAKDAGHAEFLAYMSHEMRTPLTAILGFTQSIKLAGPTSGQDVKHGEYIEHIDESAQHLLKVVQSMLTYLEDVCALEDKRKKEAFARRTV